MWTTYGFLSSYLNTCQLASVSSQITINCSSVILRCVQIFSFMRILLEFIPLALFILYRGRLIKQPLTLRKVTTLI